MRFLSKAAGIAAAFLLLACSPKYDWREVRGKPQPYTVVLPAKPASYSRDVNLDGLHVNMTMTAAEVDGVTFAVATAELPDANQAQKALAAMKTAMIRNIGGKLHYDKAITSANVAPGTTEIEAAGGSRLLLARFLARDARVYQVVVLGPEKNVSRDTVDTFFTSFQPG